METPGFLRTVAKRGLVLLCPQQAPAVPSSVFTHYKGELVISLKFIPPKKPAFPLTKGKNPTALASLKYRGIYCCMCRHLRKKGGAGERGRAARPHQRSQKPSWGETGSNVGYVCERVGHNEAHCFSSDSVN